MKKRERQTRRRNHYISRFYLSGFCDENNKGVIWIYDKQLRKSYCSTPQSTAFINDYNTFLLDGIKTVDAFERTSAMIIEEPAAKIISKIKKGFLPDSEIEKLQLATFVSYTLCQSPFWRKRISSSLDKIANEDIKKIALDQKIFLDLLEALKKENDNNLIKLANEIRKSIISGEISGVASKYGLLNEVMSIVFKLSYLIAMDNWKFSNVANEAILFTSDNPVVIDFDNECINFSISNRTLLKIGGNKSETKENFLLCSENEVALHNKLIFSQAFRYIYSTEKFHF